MIGPGIVAKWAGTVVVVVLAVAAVIVVAALLWEFCTDVKDRVVERQQRDLMKRRGER